MRQTSRASRLTAAALGALALIPASLTNAQASPTDPDPLQPLSTVLEAVCREAGLQLVYSSYLGKGLMAKTPLPGRPFEQSVNDLLRGTGLTFEYVNDHTVTIVQLKTDKPTGSTQARTGPTVEIGSMVPEVEQPPDTQFPLDLLTQVLVTGTHLTGQQPVGSQLITLTRRDMERSGYATVHDVIRTLPQNFNGGASEDYYLGVGQEGVLNFSLGTGVNLRGLGSGSTLVLLNGRRLAAGAADGRFVDIMSIPLSAIDKIEILPDGASAIYGADAVGGVVNIILRSSYDGPESMARWGGATDGAGESQISQSFGDQWESGSAVFSAEYYARDSLAAKDRTQAGFSDLRRFGGDNFDVMEGSPGTITDFINTWAIPRGQDGRALTSGDLIPGSSNLYNKNEGRDLLPEHDRWSIVGTLRQKVSDRVDLFGDVLLAQRKTAYWSPGFRQLLTVPNTNPFYVNPTGGSGPIGVYYDFGADLGKQHTDVLVESTSVTLGLASDLNHEWKATGNINYSAYGDVIRVGSTVNQNALAAALADPNPDTAFNPFGDGSHTAPATLAAIELEGLRDRNLSTRSLSFTADGPLFAGVRLAAGADYTEQSLSSIVRETIETDQHRPRTVKAAYAELMIPLVDESLRKPWLHRFQLSLAGRHESYSDFGSATTPRFGFNWSPHDVVTIRGTWSKSFKAPDLLDLDESYNGSQVVSQNYGGSTTQALIWYGGNEQLHDEHATAYTLGTAFKLPSEGLSAELTYFHIDFRDRVERIDYSTHFLEDGTYSDLVTFDPTAEQRANACQRSKFYGGAGDCLSAPITALVDMRLNNVAALQTSGVDFRTTYAFNSRFGNFDTGLTGTYLLGYSQARFQKSPLQDLLNTTLNPVDLRIRGSVSWSRQGLGVSTFVNYTNSYSDVLSKPQREVASWTTFDLQVSYTPPFLDNVLLANTTLAISAENVFDRDPPFVNNSQGIGYDNANADLLGRFVSFRINKTW